MFLLCDVWRACRVTGLAGLLRRRRRGGLGVVIRSRDVLFERRCFRCSRGFCAQTEADQRRRVHFACGSQFLILLEPLHGIGGIGIPDACGLAFEITFVNERLLDFLIPIGCGGLLARPPGSRRRSFNALPFDPFAGCFCGGGSRLLVRSAFGGRSGGCGHTGQSTQNGYGGDCVKEFHRQAKKKGGVHRPPSCHCTVNSG
jgi:hypothetical protein